MDDMVEVNGGGASPETKGHGFYWTMNFGQVLQVLVMMTSLGGLLWHQAITQTEMAKDIEAAKLRSAKYLPQLEQATVDIKLHEAKIDAIMDITKDQKEYNRTVLLTLGGMKEDIASIKSRWGIPIPAYTVPNPTTK